MLQFIAGNDHFFLNISMAASKVMLDAASGVPGSTFVTAMARNGAEFAIRTSGTGDAWFCGGKKIEGLYTFQALAQMMQTPNLGASAIARNRQALAALPWLRPLQSSASFVEQPTTQARHSRRMREITVGSNPAFTIPALDFAATASGIDARKVVDTGILPVINTGIAHREAGVGQIGAGITTAPWTCFRDALRALPAPRAPQ